MVRVYFTIFSIIKKLAVHLILVLFFCPFTFADTVKLDKVEVIAHDQSLSAGDFKTYSYEQFNGQYEDLADFISSVNGLQIFHSGGKGNPVLVSIRGASSQQTTLLLNGVKINSSQNGSYDLNVVPLSQIERIEISTSGQSNMTVNAIGGVINIVTKRKTLNEMQVSASSFEGYSLSYNNSITNNSSILISHESSKNNYSYPVPSPYNNSQNQFEKQKLNNAEYLRNSFQLNYFIPTFTSVFQWHQQQKNSPDYHRNFPGNNAYLKQEGVSLNLQGSLPTSLSAPSWIHNWKTFYRYQDEHFKDTDNVIGLGTNNDKYYTSRTEAQWRSTFQSKSWNSYFESNIFEETFLSNYLDDVDSRTCSNPEGNCDQAAFQFGLQNSLSLSAFNNTQNKKLLIQVSNQQTKNSNRTRNNQTKSNLDQHNLNHLIKYSSFIEDFDLHISRKVATRTPTLYELFGDRGFITSNPDLLPEKSISISIDALWEINTSNSASVNFFRRQLENAIVPTYDSRGVGHFENTSQASVFGLEWQWLQEWNSISFQLAGSHYQSSTSSDTPEFDDKNLAGIYHTNFKIGSEFKKGKQKTEIQYTFSNNVYIDRNNLVKGDSRKIWNINHRYHFNSIQTGIRIKNLLNHQFNDFTNRPAIGRQWHLFLNYTF